MFSKIRLSWQYGKIIYIISALLSLVMAAFVALKPTLIPAYIIMKLLSIPIIFYLYSNLSKKPEMYFYLNLGISRNEYYCIPFVVEFIAFVLMMILIGTIGYAIR